VQGSQNILRYRRYIHNLCDTRREAAAENGKAAVESRHRNKYKGKPSSARVLGETSLGVLAERETFDLNECRL
jgi:hypothetical protein